MTKQEFAALGEGDIIRGKLTGLAFIVVDRVDSFGVTIARIQQATNPDEWELISFAMHKSAKQSHAFNSVTYPKLTPTEIKAIVKDTQKRLARLGFKKRSTG